MLRLRLRPRVARVLRIRGLCCLGRRLVRRRLRLPRMPADLTALTASGITFTIDVTAGGGATGWEAEVTTGLRSGSEGFVEIDKTTPGGGEPNVIMVTVGPNETTDSRSCAIRLTSEGGGGTAATQVVSFTQEGSQGIRVVTNPVDVTSLSSAGGMFTIDVTLLGSATSWGAYKGRSDGFSAYYT